MSRFLSSHRSSRSSTVSSPKVGPGRRALGLPATYAVGLRRDAVEDLTPGVDPLVLTHGIELASHVVRWPSVDSSHFVGNMHERRDIALTPRANSHLLTAALIRRRSVYRGGPDVGAWVWSHERRASPGC
jgi:hypothetical protein